MAAPEPDRRLQVASAARWAVRQPVAAALAAVAALWCLVRFLGLDAVPYGYWMDETLGAVHVRCLAETGTTAGTRWPLFPWAHGGGVFGPTYIYLALVWIRAFGDSVASLRAIAAAANVATIAGVAAVAYRLAGPRFALTAGVCAALSPWSFQFSRIAWDPPLGPAFLVWGTFLLLGTPTRAMSALGGAVMGLAAYSYTPTRLQAAVWLPLVLAFQWRRGKLDARGVGAALGAFALTVLPMAILMLRGSINARITHLWILNPTWREWMGELRGRTPEPLFLFMTFLDHVHAHLRPTFLFLRGDANLRHSTPAAGVLGPLDVLALVLAAVALVRRPRADAPPGQASEDLRVAGLLGIGAALGIAPAALCWEGIPHALRAIGTWPFTSLLSGLVLARMWAARPWVGRVLLVVALAHSAFFLSYYFGPYRRIPPQWFHPDLAEAIARDPAKSARESLRPFAGRPGYEWPELQFYLMDHDRLGCEEAERVAREMWSGRR
jgi:hypothetical protein